MKKEVIATSKGRPQQKKIPNVVDEIVGSCTVAR